ncbi:MAG: UDP-N-acetylmuramate dehydrogenase [Ilumatobacteraceae bacterium]
MSAAPTDRCGHAAALDEAARRLAAFVARDAPLAPLTTYRVGGTAALLASPTSLDDLRLVASVVRDLALPVLVVGRGSNLLVADSGFGGIAGVLGGVADPCDRLEGDPAGEVTAGASVALPVVARRTVGAGLVGFEWAVGVPGSVGGAVRMNAGGHGSDIAGSIRTAWVLDLHSGREGQVAADRLGLRFRGSDLADHQVVLSATFALEPGPDGSTEGEVALAEVVRWRREHQPGGQNAGSVFVNPIPGELAAAQLIESCGLRGMRMGSAAVSDKHANFIQSSDGGSAADVRAVLEHVRRVVHERTGHLLRSEIRLVGFDDVEPEDRPGVSW